MTAKLIEMNDSYDKYLLPADPLQKLSWYNVNNILHFAVPSFQPEVGFTHRVPLLNSSPPLATKSCIAVLTLSPLGK